MSARPLILLPRRRIEQTTELTIAVALTRQHFLCTFIQDHLSIEITIIGLAHHYFLIYARSLLIRKAQIMMMSKRTLLRCVRCGLLGQIRTRMPTATTPSNILERALDVV